MMKMETMVVPVGSPEWRAKVSAGMRGAKPKHGTPAAYKGSQRRPGCRCRPCTQAWTFYKRERKTIREAAKTA